MQNGGLATAAAEKASTWQVGINNFERKTSFMNYNEEKDWKGRRQDEVDDVGGKNMKNLD